MVVVEGRNKKSKFQQNRDYSNFEKSNITLFNCAPHASAASKKSKRINFYWFLLFAKTTLKKTSKYNRVKFRGFS
jgi:hypothetical protein